MRGALAIAQSGGPTAVINASLAGIIMEARKHACFTGCYGLVHGIEGALKDELIDLSAESDKTLRQLIHTPASALGSSRYKIRDEDYERLIKVFQSHHIRYFAQMGGNGSMFVCHRLTQIAQQMGYELHVIGVPKTMDNDLAGTDHAPGYGSAARFMALATRDVGRDLEAMTTFEDVMILETLGRDSGWLAASTALLKEHEDEAPHLVYVPEIAFDQARFLDDIRRIHSRLGRVFVVIGEGIRDANGTLIAASSTPTDSMGRVVYSFSAGASNELANIIRQHSGLNVRILRPGLIGRTASACVSSVDREEALMVGTDAARHLANGLSDQMVTLEHGEPRTGLITLAEISGKEKPLPLEYLHENNVTRPFYDYALPLIGKPPRRLARLKGKQL